MIRKPNTAISAPPRPIQMRAVTSAIEAASISSTGWKSSRNCGTEKSNSACTVERPTRNAPGEQRAAQDREALVRLAAGLGRGARALGDQHRGGERRQRGAADQHQVRRAPQRHVLAEQPVPDVVEREAREREAGAGGHQHGAERRVPVLLQAHGRRARLGAGLGQRHREQARDEDPEQAEQDQVVRGVGERAGVAAVVDVQGDVPVHADHGDQQRAADEHVRQRRPAGHAGQPLGVRRGAADELHAPGAVADHHDERDRGHDAGHRGGQHDLADRGAAGRVGLLAGLRQCARREQQAGGQRGAEICQELRHARVPPQKLPPVSYGG